MTAGSRRRIDLRLTACALPAMAILIGLGVWQVERLDWKENLIAERAARFAAPPVWQRPPRAATRADASSCAAGISMIGKCRFSTAPFGASPDAVC